MLKWITKMIAGSANARAVKKLTPLVNQIKEIEKGYQALSDYQIQAKTDEFKERLKQGETLDDLLPEAFAVVKNVARRFTEQKRLVDVRGTMMMWEMIHYDVQLVGGIVLHQGKIAEMATGEGKTLVATLPVYLNALDGKGVHVVTVNSYLAQRDAEWMGEIYRYLGLSVGVIVREQSPDERRAQYACDITYGTNSEFGFDYLRDNGMATSAEDQVQRGHNYAIVDEVDSILIDEARTPLIISGPATVSNTHHYERYKPMIQQIVRSQTKLCNEWAEEARQLVETDEDDPQYGVNLEEAGRLLFKIKTSMPRHKQLLRMIERAELRRAMDDFELSIYGDPKRGELYKVKEEGYFSIDEKTSEANLSQMGREFLSPENPEMFTMPDLVSTFVDIQNKAGLSDDEKEKAKQEAQSEYDDASERIHNISQLLRAYCVFERDKQYVVQDNKVVIVDEFTGRAMPGRRWSDGLHQAIEAKEGVTMERETQTLATITIQNYFRLYDKLAGMTGTAETEAAEFFDIYKLGVVTIPTNRPVARVDENDGIFKTRRAKYKALIEDIREANEAGQPVLVGTVSVEQSEVISKTLKRSGIVHSVLNAKFHQQEAEIVSRAGQRGSVTIATNMAGRGTDIKLGEGVKEVGGLFVMGTERHESRRIDRQLRGRCARQGDPGQTKFYISFEDDLMRHFGDSRRISGLMTRFGMEDDEELQHPWLNKSVETAQKRVEQRNYQIRKHTLQYDDVMNMQREVVYGRRQEIITSDEPRTELFETIEEVVGDEIQMRCTGPEPDKESLVTWINTTFPIGLRDEDIDLEQGPEAIEKALLEKIRKAYEIKVKHEDSYAVVILERMIMLSAIDRLWQEHLYAMDGLRSTIQLQAIGQKDPLVEYKREAYRMFEELMGNIQLEIVNQAFRSTTSVIAFEQMLQNLPMQASHDTGVSAMSEANAASQEGHAEAEEKPRALPIRREGRKMGRNEKCPLDPSKKFKNCCGKLGEKTCIKAALQS